MTKFVRIQDGGVAEIFDALPEFAPQLMETIRDDAPDDVMQGWLFDGEHYAAPVALPPSKSDYIAAVQQLLDTTAQQRNYDGILSACSYGNSTNAQFKAEAEACIAWRDAVWTAGYAALAAVQAGTAAQPSIDDFIASLPKLTWPAVA